MKANDSNSYLPYLNKLVDQYNDIFHYSINKKPINADYSALTKKLRQILKLLKLTLISLGGSFFSHSKFKFKLFLNNLWWEPETL